MSDYLRNSILATLAYYDILDFPLTCVEINRFLVNPSRVSLFTKPIEEIRIENIGPELEKLIKLNLIHSKGGLYFLSGREHICETRVQRAKIAKEKWQKFLRLTKWLQVVPYISGFFSSGSMAMFNTDEDSDFDVLLIVKFERLYTARLLVLLAASLLDARRKKGDKVAPDKLCFNHYITDDQLHIEHHSLYTAQTYANLKPIIVTGQVFDDFFHANSWINKYLYNFKPDRSLLKPFWNSNILGKIFKKTGELILNSKIGDFIERIAKKYQQSRIKKNPITYNSGGRVIFTDNELEFHPKSFEKFLISSYNNAIKKLGIIPPFEEKDSGLK